MGELRDNKERSRFEWVIDDQIAAIEDYQLDGDTITYIHTESMPEFRGKGSAKELVAAILDHAVARDFKVIPECSYVAKFIRENTDYIDLVPEERRAAFNL